MVISRLDRVPIREVWPKEEKDFTPWLEKNIDLLSDVLGLTLVANEREAKVGRAFEADLLAEGPSNELVVIENQFGRSNHDHLGKILTYLTTLDAKRAIWICEDPQPEHIAAVDWFNKYSPSDMGFYLLKLEAYKIENSPSAPLFSVVSEPSELIKEAGEFRDDLAERHIKRLEFWKQLLEKSNTKTSLFTCISPGKDNWLSAGAGISGVVFQYIIRMGDGRVQLTMESPDASKNKQIFDALSKDRAEIEELFEDTLIWDRMDDFKSSRIWKNVSNKGLRDSESWPATIDKMTSAMVRLNKAFGKKINQLSI